jgi:hypothetical protein
MGNNENEIHKMKEVCLRFILPKNYFKLKISNRTLQLAYQDHHNLGVKDVLVEPYCQPFVLFSTKNPMRFSFKTRID